MHLRFSAVKQLNGSSPNITVSVSLFFTQDHTFCMDKFYMAKFYLL